MGLLGRKKKEATSSFSLGVEDVLLLPDSEDVIVAGTLWGRVYEGAAVYLDSPGRDDDVMALLTVKEVKQGKKTVKFAEDCPVTLRIENGKHFGIHKGTVVFSSDQPGKSVYAAYLAALDNAYVYGADLDLDESTLAQMSSTDLAETGFLFNLRREQEKREGHASEARKCTDKEKMDRLIDVLCGKLLGSETLFCLYHERTGEPVLFSRVIAQGDGYLCTPPEILVITKAQLEADIHEEMSSQHIWKRIKRGSDGDGIKNFFNTAFYLNGAAGVIVGGKVAIDAKKLVPSPNFASASVVGVTVTNPDLERWLLLMGQVDKKKDESERLAAGIYAGYVLRACKNARFLLPLKKDAVPLSPYKKGPATLQKDAMLSIPTVAGKGNRRAVCVFTDWKRMRMACGMDWDAIVVTLGELIEQFDIAVNLTEKMAGYYIDKDLYVRISHQPETA